MRLPTPSEAGRTAAWTLFFYLALSLVLNPDSRPVAGQVQFLYGLF